MKPLIRRLANHQHFTDVVPGEKEFDGSEVAEQGFDMAVVEYALQLETIFSCGLRSTRWPATGIRTELNFLHFQSIGAHDVKAVTRRIRPRIAGMKKSQQHATRFQHGP